MKIKFKYGEKTVLLEPYTSAQEKELLLIPLYTPEITEDSLNDALMICKYPDDISKLTLKEKIMLLWRYREISISDNISVAFTCPHCHTRSDNEVVISKIWQDPLKHSEFIQDNYDETADIKISEDAEIDEYIALKKNISDYIGHYNFIRECTCQKCQKKIKIPLNGLQFTMENMSDKSIQGVYSQYNSLIYFGHYSKLDIDSMYPFERDVMSGLLKKTLDDINKAKNERPPR